ncbi:pancreatic triacylglycerol lipase-like [Anopheles nili]|uniref:pancreatic triacylglycerol lipase-like n=1 Tax=Anopheles nili TaxID=185578 RepID=UPI00237BB68D|nr:pancreatic triacylglycerol lipase-like [Anopheles nili]
MDSFRLVRYSTVFLFALAFHTSVGSNYDEKLKTIKLFYYSQRQEQEVDGEIFEPLEIDPHKPLKLVIHGWNSNRDEKSIIPIRTGYLLQNKCNLLMADWSEVANIRYLQARTLVQKIGLRIGQLLANFTEGAGIEHGQVHVIGHSLGAHIAGKVGRYFDGKLSRVTALDPAGPFFDKNSKDAISSDVAQFVDVIHTDGEILGAQVPLGHADFFPNGGVPPQPGCEKLDLLTLHGCSHLRSTGFFAESIQQPNNFIACACSMEEIANKRDSCLPDYREKSLRECVTMGEAVDHSVRGTFFTVTSAVPPYGLGNHTQIEPHIKFSSQGQSTQ